MYFRMANCMVPNAPQSIRKKIPELCDAILNDPRFSEKQKEMVRRFQSKTQSKEMR